MAQDREPLHIHVHIHNEQWEQLTTALETINRKLTTIIKQEKELMSEIDTLTTDVENNASVTDSVVTMISGLAQQIRDLSGNPAALQELANSLEASTKKLSDAVVANTPAA